jgi:hypothetical protein
VRLPQRAAQRFRHGSVTPRQPGTMTVPARASSAAPPSTSTRSPPAARSGPGSSAATPKRYQSGPISGRGRPNTSTGHAEFEGAEAVVGEGHDLAVGGGSGRAALA